MKDQYNNNIADILSGQEIRNINKDIDISPEEVKRLRLKMNLTQKEMAKIFGVSHSYIQKKEINKLSPSYRKMSNSESIVTLLLANEHPHFKLVKK